MFKKKSIIFYSLRLNFDPVLNENLEFCLLGVDEDVGKFNENSVSS